MADGSVNFSTNIVSTATDWNKIVNVPKFDSSLGTLASISYTITGTLTGTAQASNNSSQSGITVKLNLEADLLLTDPSLNTLVESFPLVKSTNSLSAWDGVTTLPDYSAPSGVTISGISTNYTTSALFTSISNPGELALFTGTGNIPLNMSAGGLSFASGGGNVTSTFTTFADATVQVVYNYTTAVPEASTWAAIGFVGLAGGATYLRRRQSKANA